MLGFGVCGRELGEGVFDAVICLACSVLHFLVCLSDQMFGFGSDLLVIFKSPMQFVVSPSFEVMWVVC